MHLCMAMLGACIAALHTFADPQCEGEIESLTTEYKKLADEDRKD
jgi:hypothetical protein